MTSHGALGYLQHSNSSLYLLQEYHIPILATIPEKGQTKKLKESYLENLVYHFFRQLWLVLGVKLMEINSNLFSRYVFFYWRCCLHQDLNDLTKSKSGSIMVRSMAWGALLFQSWNPPPEHHFTPHFEAINFSHEWKGGQDSTRCLGDYHQRSSHGYLGRWPVVVSNLIFGIFTLKIGEDVQFDEYFSDGLVQPPTSFTPLTSSG